MTEATWQQQQQQQDRGTAFLGGAVVKNLPASAGDMGLIPGLGRSPGEGNRNLLHYSRLGSPMDRGVWWAIVPEVMEESETI